MTMAEGPPLVGEFGLEQPENEEATEDDQDLQTAGKRSDLRKRMDFERASLGIRSIPRTGISAPLYSRQ